MLDSVLTDSDREHRRLCIAKDLLELADWIDTLAGINEELVYLKLFIHKLIKDPTLERNLLQLRRNNTLLLGKHCGYEQELKSELAYGKTVYSLSRASIHEKKRFEHQLLLKEFLQFKTHLYKHIANHKKANSIKI